MENTRVIKDNRTGWTIIIEMDDLTESDFTDIKNQINDPDSYYNWYNFYPHDKLWFNDGADKIRCKEVDLENYIITFGENNTNGINPKAFDTVEFYPEQIAARLCSIAFETVERGTVESVKQALEMLQATAQNPYNDDCYRVLYRVLETITSYD